MPSLSVTHAFSFDWVTATASYSSAIPVIRDIGVMSGMTGNIVFPAAAVVNETTISFSSAIDLSSMYVSHGAPFPTNITYTPTRGEMAYMILKLNQ